MTGDEVVVEVAVVECVGEGFKLKRGMRGVIH